MREEESDPAKAKESWVHTNLLLKIGMSTFIINFSTLSESVEH